MGKKPIIIDEAFHGKVKLKALIAGKTLKSFATDALKNWIDVLDKLTEFETKYGEKVDGSYIIPNTKNEELDLITKSVAQREIFKMAAFAGVNPEDISYRGITIND
jgi:hypothetical protein